MSANPELTSVAGDAASQTKTARPEYIFKNRLPMANRLGRRLWQVTWLLLFRPSPTPLHAWRRFLLRLFGARIEPGALPYPRCRIWAPWNLHMAVNSCIANDAECYSVACIYIGANASISQYAYLCTASHDIDSADLDRKSVV